MEFDGTEKTIGHGAQAEVLLYHGFAYKIYKSSYPAGQTIWKDIEALGISEVDFYEAVEVSKIIRGHEK